MGNKKTKTLEQLAYEYVALKHPNDKSGDQIARMNRRFGRKATAEAIVNARKILALIDPDNPRAKEEEISGWPNIRWFNPPRGIQGKSMTLSIIDEAKQHTKEQFDALFKGRFAQEYRKQAENHLKDALLYGTGVIRPDPRPAYGGFDAVSIMKEKSCPPILFDSLPSNPETSSSSDPTSPASTEPGQHDTPSKRKEPSGDAQ